MSSRSSATSARCRRWRRFPGDIRDGWRSSAPTRSISIRGRCSAARKAKIVANLPYNIATALLIDWLSIEPWPPWYDMMVLMFQREVAERIVARENDEAYGRLAVLANWRAETKILFDISPAAFVPQPKVTSSVVRLVPRSAPEPCDRRALEQVAAAAFGQRRKMLRQSLKSLAVDPARLAAAAGCRSDAARRDRSGLRLCCHGPRIDQYTQHKIERAVKEKRHGADATPVTGQIRCAAVRNHRRDPETAGPGKCWSGSSAADCAIPTCISRTATPISAAARGSTPRAA